MRQKKICMLGTSGVGKTSLVSKFVHSMFSDKYLTTVGVKIDRMTVNLGEKEVLLMIWDLAGDDEFGRLQTSYLRGTDGYLLVADGTRLVTLDMAAELQQRVTAAIGPLPFVFVLNKADLTTQWKVEDERIATLTAKGLTPIITSAKGGFGVEEAFVDLARLTMAVQI